MGKRGRDNALTEEDYLAAARPRAASHAEHRRWMSAADSVVPFGGERGELMLPAPMSKLCFERALDKLRHSPGLRALRLRARCNQSERVPLDQVFAAAGHAPLRELDLSDCTLDIAALDELAAYVAASRTLTTLSVEHAFKIYAESTAPFALALTACTTLTTLNLAGVRLSSTEMRRIALALKFHPALADLDAGDNPFCAAALAEIGRHPTLRRLRCDNMRMSYEAAATLFAALAELPALHDLTVGNENPDVLMDQLRAVLAAGKIRDLTIRDMSVGMHTLGWTGCAPPDGVFLDSFAAVNLPQGSETLLVHAAPRVQIRFSVRGMHMDGHKIPWLARFCRAATLEFHDVWPSPGVPDVLWCENLGGALAANAHVAHLDITGVPLSPDGAVALISSLGANSTLSSLAIAVQCVEECADAPVEQVRAARAAFAKDRATPLAVHMAVSARGWARGRGLSCTRTIKQIR